MAISRILKNPAIPKDYCNNPSCIDLRSKGMLMSVWHDLYKAKQNSQRISDEIAKIIREHNGLTKKEIVAQNEKLSEDVKESAAVIEEEYRELIKNIAGHSKALAAKSRFLRRHNKNGFV